jgi:polysaccharide export outer membrane protein
MTLVSARLAYDVSSDVSSIVAAARPRRAAAAGVACLCALLLLILLSVAAPASADDYRVGPRDVIEIVVVGETDLTGKYTVRTDGSFEFPLVGTVKVAGLTAAEVESRLRQLLGDGYLRNPQVSAKVLDFESQRVFVGGDVGKPGHVQLTGPLTLLEVLTQAGGVERTAGDEVVVLRQSDQHGAITGPVVAGQPGVQEIARVSLDDLQSGRAKDNVVLKNGDTIFVPKAGFIYVKGAVKNPGPFQFQRGFTVMEAINAAGGETKEGKPGAAEIERIVDGQRKTLKTKPTDPLKAGDTVIVPTRWF